MRVAIAVLSIAITRDDLVNWWLQEKPNRIRFRLSPDQDPGLKLKEAFDLKLKELKHANLTSVSE